MVHTCGSTSLELMSSLNGLNEPKNDHTNGRHGQEAGDEQDHVRDGRGPPVP